MLRIITGIPGSGKSYFAVNYLYDTFQNDKSTHFGENTHFYTNINEFKFDFFSNGIGFYLDFDDLYTKLTTLHYSAVTLKKNDKDLKEEAKELGLLSALFVLDEAQNYFDKDDKVLVWWLSYHRHIDQNIILLSQSLDLMHAKYKKFSESFLRAVPSSLRIISSVFRYKDYIGSRMSANQLTGTVKLKFNVDVYSLYHSGANTQGKKVVWKFLAIFAVLLIVFVLIIFGIARVWSSRGVKKDENTTSSSKSFGSSASSSVSSKSYEDVRLLCNSKSCICNGAVLTSADVDNLKHKYEMKLLSFSPFDADFSVYVYRSKIGVSDEILGHNF
jgi:zona occludens toxin